MIDLRDYWVWSWRNLDRDQSGPADQRRALVTGLALAASIVAPLLMVALHIDRQLLAWMSRLL